MAARGAFQVLAAAPPRLLEHLGEFDAVDFGEQPVPSDGHGHALRAIT